MGIGTFGSRSAQLAGSAIVVAADRLIDKGRQIAAHMMEAAADDIAFERGRFHDRRHRPLGRRSTRSRGRRSSRRNCRTKSRPGLPSARISARPNAATFPSGAHVCEVEIDAETGAVALTRYCAVDDVGHDAEPAVVRGADPWRHRPGARPGVARRSGLRPESGQLLTGSFQDYAMPRADNFCRFELRGERDADRPATRSASRASARPARSARSRR